MQVRGAAKDPKERMQWQHRRLLVCISRLVGIVSKVCSYSSAREVTAQKTKNLDETPDF